MDSPIGLIAGQGMLPVLTARGIRAAGRRVACVGLAGQYLPELPAACDHFAPVGLLRLGQWLRRLRRWNVREAVMVGRVAKVRMYHPYYLFQALPDWRAARIWFGRTRHDRRTEKLLGAVADELQLGGVTLVDSTQYIPEQMAGAGTLTRARPNASHEADIAFGIPLMRRLAELDIGQSIAVKAREVVAIEAVEGTDAMIRRAGDLCRRGGWTLIKLGKATHDMRFDVPTVGAQTLASMHAAGATCLAVAAGSVILLDKETFLRRADELGIAVVGVEMQ